MPRFLGICFLAAALFGLAACDQKEPEQGETPDLTEATIKLTTAKDKLVIDSEEGSVLNIIFACDHKWKLIVPEESGWLTFDKTEGEAGKLIGVKATAAANPGSERVAECEIVSGVSSLKFNVTQKQASLVLTAADVEDLDRYYQPKEFTFDMMNSSSKWSFCRSKQSEHFIVFWDIKYGEYGLYGDRMGVENTSPSTCKTASMRVDIDDLLEKAEQFFDTNVNKLKMAELGVGKSYLDDYKMEIYIIWQTEWLATGSGYDNVIGALWVNPSTCKPVGSTIAHEIGHSFQYQTYCDKVYQGEPDNLQYGFRYGFGPRGEGGCAYWEQCAQWQSFQDYPSQQFGHDLNVFKAQYNRHYHHEWMRYASYWLQSYWVEKRGVEAYGEIWRQSVLPEDAIKTYTKLYNDGDWSKTADELYDYAARMATFDIDGVREYAGSNVTANHFKTTLFKQADGYYQVSYGSCPSTAGFNIVPLNLPDEEGAVVTASFKGLQVGSALPEGDTGNFVNGDLQTIQGTATTYNNVGNGKEGWRYGFVALNADGTRVYGDMFSSKDGVASFSVPAGAEYLYFVVLGAPTEYRQNEWDDDEKDDDQWPYKVKFGNTDLLGNFEIDETADPKDVTITFDVKCDASNGGYPLGTIDLSSSKKLAQAFVLNPSAISALVQGVNAKPSEGKVVWGLEQTDGSYAYNSTANNGFWCTAGGDLTNWGADAFTYVEFDGLTITYGHYPGHSVAGETYTLKPTLIYTKDGKEYKATIQINMAF
ncbi:MAG: DUF4859 domain-containing protein [Bacteroidales bacterium]|nr:DUF4859 domain-containing protein [Bacteroidales bacterium]